MAFKTHVSGVSLDMDTAEVTDDLQLGILDIVDVYSLDGSVLSASTDASVVRNISVSTSDPSGGADGDVWLKYTA